MKRIIRWLADVSGVTEKIQQEHTKFIGSQMTQYSYWFTGGLMHKEPLNDISNAFYLYADTCLNNGVPHLYGCQHMSLRERLYKMNEDKKLIFDEKKSNGDNK